MHPGNLLILEELDLVSPPDMTLPKQEPADAIRRLPYGVRFRIRLNAMVIAGGLRTGALEVRADYDPFKGFVDAIYGGLKRKRISVPYDAVDAYFRKAYRDAEEWYAAERTRKSRRRGKA